MYLSCGHRFNVGERLDVSRAPRRVRPRGVRIPNWNVISAAKEFPPTAVGAGFRSNYEFYAVIRGKLALISPEERLAAEAYHENSLWVLPPDSRHSWHVPPGTSCEVLVFHFSSIPPLLKNHLQKMYLPRISFAPREAGLLVALFERLLADYSRPVFASGLRFEAAVHELSAFFLEHVETLKDLPALDPSAQIVANAVQWFQSHFHEGAGINETARALGLTSGYLRKLFLKIHGKSTKSLFNEIRMDLAKELLLHPSLSLKEIAIRCGYEGYSQFYRAFRRTMGITPVAWRQGTNYGRRNALNVPVLRRNGVSRTH